MRPGGPAGALPGATDTMELQLLPLGTVPVRDTPMRREVRPMVPAIEVKRV